MSSVWLEMPGNRWNALAIGEGSLTDPELAVEGARFVRFGHGGDQCVLLLAQGTTEAWVNGQPVLGGLRVLEHKDEILVSGARLFFSAESTPVPVLYRATAGVRTPTCPVCRGPVKDGDRGVQCPGCGRWFHEIEADNGRARRNCWTYAATCRFCDHPTAFSAESTWRPEMEEDHA
jgi:hypothetical protein